jgi:hypothetical protein
MALGLVVWFGFCVAVEGLWDGDGLAGAEEVLGKVYEVGCCFGGCFEGRWWMLLPQVVRRMKLSWGCLHGAAALNIVILRVLLFLGRTSLIVAALDGPKY